MPSGSFCGATSAAAKSGALLTGGCFALIHFSSEARGYSLAVFFALAATFFLERDLDRPRWWSAGFFGACAVFGILSHLITLFYYAGAAAQSTWRLLRRSGDRRSGALYREGGWRRGLCLAALAAFTLGNAVHTLAFLEHGRGGYRAALLYMARHTDGPRLVVGSDNDFRNEMVLRFYERSLPEGKELLYHRRGGWPRRGPDWLITHAGHRPEKPLQHLRDDAGNRFELAAEFDHAASSGFYRAVYRNASAGSPPAGS